MAKRKPEVRMASHGVYTPFKRDSDALPKPIEITSTIPAKLGIEFGYTLIIRKARGALLTFRIEHPPFHDEPQHDDIFKPFEGEQYVRSNDYTFFLGDTFWEPLSNKVGTWTLTTWLDDERIARKAFDVVASDA